MYKRLIIPSNWSIGTESMYKSVQSMVQNTLGKTIYFPQMFSLFYVILFCNLIGQVPYSYTPTVQQIFTLAVGLTILGGVQLQGVIRHGTMIFGYFCPEGTPIALVPLMVQIEVVSYLTRTFSLGLRLSINMITGHILVKVFSGFIWQGFSEATSLLGVFIITLPLVILTAFLALEILIAYLQAYIFTFLICITLKDLL